MASAHGRFAAKVVELGGPEKAAYRLGCTRSYVDMLLQGKRKRPGMTVAARIETAFGIPMIDWVRSRAA